MVYVKQGKTAAAKKATKGKFHGCGMVNDDFFSDFKVISEEAKKIIIAAKRHEWQAKKKGLVATAVEKEEVESDNTENPPEPTHEELKDIFGFKNLNVHHRDGDDVADFGFCQVGTHTDKVPMINPETSGVDDKYDATMTVISDNRMNTGMTFVDIFCGNQPPKSVVRVRHVIPTQKKHMTQKNQVARFTRAWWNMYLDSCGMYHIAFVTWLLKIVEDYDSTMVDI